MLHFTEPISVNTTLGNPSLLLRVDPTMSNTTTLNSTVFNDTDGGIRYAEHIPGLTQFVDVGVDASR